MHPAYRFANSNPADIDTIFQLFDSAIEYQKKNGYDLWPQFERKLIEAEIAEKRHWKILHNGTVACIFSVMYSDPVIWGAEKNADPAVYLHRITINPSYKGKGMMNIIRQWAEDHARQNGKKFVRMDTWGNNESLKSYYISCGFSYIGRQHLVQAPGLPAHYGGSVLSLFEIEV
jgi:GNAT superfamily N-acetyltransferase